MESENARTQTDSPDAVSEHVATEIHRRLCATGYHVLRFVECEFRDGMVVLRGRVPTYYYKQVAQSMLLTDPCVTSVVNLIEVLHSGRNGHKTFGMDSIE